MLADHICPWGNPLMGRSLDQPQWTGRGPVLRVGGAVPLGENISQLVAPIFTIHPAPSPCISPAVIRMICSNLTHKSARPVVALGISHKTMADGTLSL